MVSMPLMITNDVLPDFQKRIKITNQDYGFYITFGACTENSTRKRPIHL